MENKGQVRDNKGQLRPEIIFTAKSGGAKVFITATSVNYEFVKINDSTGNNRDGHHLQSTEHRKHCGEHGTLDLQRFAVSLEGANPNPKVHTEQPNPFVENYYKGHCPKGISAHTYEKLVVENVYPGIDWILYTKGQSIKYDFVVHPGADPAQIRLHVDGAASSGVSQNGELYMTAALGEVREHKPISFSGENSVNTDFVVLGNNNFGFKLDVYDPKQTLTIDPSVVWSTYFGGHSQDVVNSCATDAAGNVLMTGYTQSLDFLVTAGAFQDSMASGTDAFMAKFDPNGNPLWVTYFGGANWETASSCSVDASGNLFVAGYTTSSDFPVTAGAAQNSYGGGTYDAFLVKLNNSGNRVWTTYFGGNNDDEAVGCAVDGQGNVFVTGFTSSPNFPITTSASQNILTGTSDAFLAKFSPSGTNLWSTFYGGSQEDLAGACTADANGNVFITGRTNSTDLPVTQGALQANLAGNWDAYLAKFSPSGNRIWSTYYGGNNYEMGFSCATDRQGNVMITGVTNSTMNLPVTSGAIQSIYGGGFEDGFIAKINPTGSLLWSTYYGGISDDEFLSCSVAPAGNIFLSGSTNSSDFLKSAGTIQLTYFWNEAFLINLSSKGKILWTTYYGGNSGDFGRACATDTSGNVFFCGSTSSSDFPITPSAIQDSLTTAEDGFAVKIFDTIGRKEEVDTSTGVANLANTFLTVNLFPNPNNGTFTINGNVLDKSPHTVNLEVFNIVGQKVYEEVLNIDNGVINHQIHLQNMLSPGNYLLHVQDGSGRILKFAIFGEK